MAYNSITGQCDWHYALSSLLMSTFLIRGRGKGRGEIRGEAGEVTGVVANVPTTNSLGKRYRVFSGWQLEKRRYCWWLVGLMWIEVQKPNLSTNMLISIKVTWEGEMVQVNRTA